MNVASIDPGVTTGLVISYVKVRIDIVTITPLLVVDNENQPTVMSLIRSNKCRNVFMEQKPSRPSKEGLDNWEWLFQKLTETDHYNLAKNMFIQQQDPSRRRLYLIQPSHWKPFMKNRRALLPKPLPHHARDAFMMLHYAIQVNYPNKEIIYAE